MRLLSADIRGATGFHLGMGIDEVHIDFTKFQPGLIALVGSNGVGKTTFMEMLQPFNQLVSRKGKIQDHFRLKDSYKNLKVEMNDNLYEINLLIDGITGKAEGYIKENNIPLNDGKIETFKEHCYKIFGTPELFFNAIFSAQKATGIASLRFNERRALFYEILNLLRYEPLCKNAGKRKTNEEKKLATLEGELAILKSEVDSITYTKPMIAEKIYLVQEKNKLIKVANEELVKIKARLDEANAEVIKLSIIKNQQDSIKEEKEKVEEKINSHNETIENEKANLRKLCNDELVSHESGCTYFKEIEKLQSDQKVAEEKKIIDEQGFTEEIKAINDEILKQQTTISAAKIQIERAERIETNKTTINVKLTRKKTISEELSKLMLEDKSFTDQLNNLKTDKTNRLQNTKETSIKLDHDGRAIIEINNKISADEKRVEELKREKKNKIDEVENETQILNNVPCDEEMGSRCPLISNTLTKKHNLDQVQKEYDDKINTLNATIETNKTEVLKKQEALSNKEADNKKEIENIENEFTPQINHLNTQLEDIAKKIKTFTKELTEINENDWEKLSKELSEAESTKKIAQQSINHANQIIVEKEKSKKSLESNLNKLADNLADKIQTIQEQIENKKKLFTQERQAINNKYDAKIKSIDDNSATQLESLQNRLNELQKQYDPEIEKHYQEEQEKVNKIEEEHKEASKTIETLKNELADQEAEIKMMEDALIKKALTEDKVKEKEAAKQFHNREISEYYLIEKAFDKTGIPILKLENSGYEITDLANELLNLFDNKFRIVFETLQMKADKSGMKEVFNINVMDEEGICEISNKSGGQQVWLEIALQLAIGLMVRKQGKKILTGFIDEKDGALDLENAYHFLDMVRKVHQLSGTYHTFLITHRTELQNLIPQQILFTTYEGIELITEGI